MATRRSARTSGRKAKYISDPFVAAGVLSDGSDTDKLSKRKRKGKGRAKELDLMDLSGSSAEFVAQQDDEEEEEERGDEEFIDEDIDKASSEGIYSSRASEVAVDDHEDEKECNLKATLKPWILKSRKQRNGKATESKQMRSRGLHDSFSRAGKVSGLHVNFGADERDLLAMVYARDRWYRGIDSTFPSRNSLNQAEVFPDYGYGPTFGSDPDDLKRERRYGWDWYYNADTEERHRKRQHLESIEEHEARRTYMPTPCGKHTVLIGPADGQEVIEMAQGEVFNFGEVWGKYPPGKEKADVPVEVADSKPLSAVRAKIREGWIINIGQKIQAMGWAPNQRGLTQYLAVVAPITEEQKAGYPDPLKAKAAPAFRPSAPYPSTLQIWSWKARRADGLTRGIDMDFKPKLRLAFCTDWGDLRRIAWCPMARDPREEDDEDVMKNVGLLAGVWADGTVRVIDVKTTRGVDVTEFFKIHSAIFEAKPPSTLCTCVTWLSPSDIAVGCADGFVAIWNIASTQLTSAPLPYFYERIHSSYILSIASAYPTHPHLIATSSMDGETRLSSILQPHVDVTETPRIRIGSPHIVFSPVLQSFLSSEDSDSIRLLALRRFFSTISIARIPSIVSALATPSVWHPSILIGCSSGAVIATNPIRKVLSPKAKQWQLIWFTHEWVPRADSSGVSRFFDGFKAEQIGSKRDMGPDQSAASDRSSATIFEEGTHITALVWNPNQSCAGWATAGMGCGLIRVEDMAI